MTKKSKEAPVSADEMSCSDGWYVTGYYTCAETQFHGTAVQIVVTGTGTDQFPSDFLSAVRMEGWGQTRHGWFLGWSGGKWINGNAPLNAVGMPLQTGAPNSLAVDRSVIPIGTHVMIPSLPAPWNTTLFVADDTGGAIIGKHVDVYCGVGAQAEAETFRITSHAGKVCLG